MHGKMIRIVVPILSLVIVFGMVYYSIGAENTPTSYVSPMQYQDHDCDQLVMEGRRIRYRVSQMAGKRIHRVSDDKAIIIASALVFWPDLFFLGETEQQEAEYSRLKGEYEAVQQARVLKKCKNVKMYLQ